MTERRLTNRVVGTNRSLLPENAILHNKGYLRDACDLVIDHAPHGSECRGNLAALLEELRQVRDGAVVYIQTDMVGGFFAEVFPHLRARVVLVTIGRDWATPGPRHRHLDDTRIIRWFGQNCDLCAPHPKFEPLPLGVAEPHLSHGDQAAMLRVHRRMRPVSDKPLKAYATFHLNLSHPGRYRVWQQIFRLPHIVFEPHRIPPELLWIRHANYAFEVCPRGAGSDCHRIWEALLLHTIPIVQTSCLDPLFAVFPVVAIADWREITLEAVARWRAQLAHGFISTMLDRLTGDYWLSRIMAAAAAASSAPKKPDTFACKPCLASPGAGRPVLSGAWSGRDRVETDGNNG